MMPYSSTSSGMYIWKFSGVSVANAERIQSDMSIFQSTPEDKQPGVIVVSAFGGVTDQFLELANAAWKGQDISSLMSVVHSHHRQVAATLGCLQELSETIEGIFSSLNTLIERISTLHEFSDRHRAQIVSFGEILSATIIAAAFRETGIEAEFVDARTFIRTDSRYMAALVQHEETKRLIQNHFQTKQLLQIVTGYIGCDEIGDTTTLGREGSDYSAALIASALHAEELHLWKDVRGIFSADPRKVPEAFLVEEASYEEIMELACYDNNMIFPPSLQPVRQANIPVIIRSSFDPDCSGTRVSSTPKQKDAPVIGLSSIEEISLITVEGSGMVGVPGISGRIFQRLASENISVILISQTSSEHSICFAVQPGQAIQTEKLLKREFSLELKNQRIDRIRVERHLSLLTIVGDKMRYTSGVSASIYKALATANVNVIAAAQGSTEISTSFIVASDHEIIALRVIHDRVLREVRVVDVVLFGPGRVGKNLLQQIAQQAPILSYSLGYEIRLIGIVNSTRCYFNEEGINWATAMELFREESDRYSDLVKLTQRIIALDIPNICIIDCTSTDDFSEFYQQMLSEQIMVIASNTKVQTGTQETYDTLHEISRRKRTPFLYETSVGAALPILNALRSMQRTGDKIHRIEGVLSGTLSYLFAHFSTGRDFPELVDEARKKNFTERDPREDLCGIDVARRLLILARECGRKLELSDIHIEPLLPDQCMNAPSIDHFLVGLPEEAHLLTEKRDQARARGNHLHYVATFDSGGARIALQEIGSDSPFFNLEPGDNLISITSDRYASQPLVFQGASAGPEIIASGAFADLLVAIEQEGAM